MMITDFLEATANKKIYSYDDGKYNVVEYIRDISVNAATAQTAYFMSEMNIHKRQLAVNLNDNAVIVQAGAMQVQPIPGVTQNTAPTPEPTTFGGGLRGVSPLTSRVESRQIKIPDFL